MGSPTVQPDINTTTPDSSAGSGGAGAGTAQAIAPGTSAAAATAPAPEPTTTSAAPQTASVAGTVLAIKVSFELDTEDGLRKVFLGLEKDMKGSDPIWIIHFQLQERERTTDNFISVVTLDVQVDEAALQPAAETAARTGLTPPQAAHVLGPAADDAKGTTTGDVDPDDAKETLKGTFTA